VREELQADDATPGEARAQRVALTTVQIPEGEVVDPYHSVACAHGGALPLADRRVAQRHEAKEAQGKDVEHRAGRALPSCPKWGTAQRMM
jgi:hypothetical protein